MTTEPPRPDQIQANVAAALSRLRGELAPTPPVASGGPEPEAGKAADGEPQFDVGPTLSAPDPSMALNPAKPTAAPTDPTDPLDTPFARMTGLKPIDQPDLLSGISAPPPLADIADAEAEAAHRRRRFRNRLVAGGILVLALAGFWYWSSSGEGGSETVPVITADSSPEKVKPADEGGLEVPNQDVAILNGENSAAPSQGETVLPAPEQPATPPAPPPAAPAEPAATSEAAPAASNGVPSVAAPAVDAIPSVPAPTELGVATSDAAAPAAAPATSEAAPVPAEEPTQTATTEPATSEAAPAAETTQAAAPAAAGSARIQLAAVKSEAAAQKEWARLQKANPDLLGGLSLHVERFNKTASEVYYRIQAGPLADKAAAKQLCAQLKQKNQACLVAN